MREEEYQQIYDNRYESNKIEKQGSRNLNDTRAVESLIQDITSLYGQNKHRQDGEVTKQF